MGVQPLLDAVCWYLPSPLDVPPAQGTDPRDGSEVVREPKDDAPFSALVFKIQASPAADLFYIRVYSGPASKPVTAAWNPRTEKPERLRRMLRCTPTIARSARTIDAGDIIAVGGLHASDQRRHAVGRETRRSCSSRSTFLDPVVSIAIEPKTKADQDKLGAALQRLAEEDPRSA